MGSSMGFSPVAVELGALDRSLRPLMPTPLTLADGGWADSVAAMG